ncbi:MAG TPA: hypothetical protein VFQ45_13995 [Longimicrobium sp.]|nr:hypothetical protein [Longimicrobium sp.]
MSESPNPTRRDFAKAAAAAAMMPLLAPLAACASAAEPAGSPAPAPAAPPPAASTTPAGTPTPGAAPQPQQDPIVEPLLEVVRIRYGSRLTPEQLQSVREGINGNLQLARRLRQFELPITTEPAFAYRVPGGVPR